MSGLCSDFGTLPGKTFVSNLTRPDTLAILANAAEQSAAAGV